MGGDEQQQKQQLGEGQKMIDTKKEEEIGQKEEEEKKEQSEEKKEEQREEEEKREEEGEKEENREKEELKEEEEKEAQKEQWEERQQKRRFVKQRKCQNSHLKMPKAHRPFAGGVPFSATISPATNAFPKQPIVGLPPHRRHRLAIGDGALRALANTQNAVRDAFEEHSLLLHQIGKATLLVGWHIFLTLAAFHSLRRASPLLTLTAIGWAIFVYFRLMARPLRSAVKPIRQTFNNLWRHTFFKKFFFLFVICAIVAFLFFDTTKYAIHLIIHHR
ncbi:hypothetical protein niasHT_008009 [Heterodera trifolii]|uniref:Uncharacterized protein n=1 Tax=Heterodera trifolii TaxID=157864 RepID=A0ABD2M0T8_9BILA